MTHRGPQVMRVEHVPNMSCVGDGRLLRYCSEAELQSAGCWRFARARLTKKGFSHFVGISGVLHLDLAYYALLNFR